MLCLAALKHAESSNLPRQARARIGQTTDPVPEGKTVDASPEWVSFHPLCRHATAAEMPA